MTTPIVWNIGFDPTNPLHQLEISLTETLFDHPDFAQIPLVEKADVLLNLERWVRELNGDFDVDPKVVK